MMKRETAEKLGLGKKGHLKMIELVVLGCNILLLQAPYKRKKERFLKDQIRQLRQLACIISTKKSPNPGRFLKELCDGSKDMWLNELLCAYRHVEMNK